MRPQVFPRRHLKLGLAPWLLGAILTFGTSVMAIASELNTGPLRDVLLWGQAQGPEQQPSYQRWQDWLRNEPERFGVTRYFNEPLIAGASSRLRISYETGVELGVGSKVTVLTPFDSGIVLQTELAASPNYIQVRASADLVPVDVKAIVPFASWYAGASVLGFEVVGEAIAPGTTLEFDIQNLQLPGRAGPFYLPVAVVLPEETVTMFGEPAELTIQPSQLARVELSAPSRLGRREPGQLELRLMDRFGNLTDASTPTFDLIVNGKFDRRIEPTGAVTQISGVNFAQEGRNIAEVRTGGGGLRTESNPVFVQSGNKQIFWRDVSPDDDHMLQRASLRRGGALLTAQSDRGLRDIAVPYLPTDERSLDPKQTLFAQIVAGDSQYEWFANRVLQQGYRVGFVAGGFSPLRPLGLNARSGLTAMSGPELWGRGTYVTTGAKMIVNASINGGQPGSRVPRSKERRVTGWVQGTGPIDRVELVKNGEVIRTLSVAADLDSDVLKLSVFSSSEPLFGQRDLPRNGREWIGFVRTPNSSLNFIDAPGFRYPERQAAQQNGNNRVDFITWTHGGFSSLLLSLDSSEQPDEVLELSFRDGTEDVDISPALRPVSNYAVNRQMIPLFDLAEGPVTRSISVAGYQDLIRVERVNPEAPDYVAFSFTDASPFATEDYYYLKIYQLDDQVAWTSPVFVGGFDTPH